MGFKDIFKNNEKKKEETIEEAKERLIQRETEEKEKSDLRIKLKEAGKQAWLANSILCIVYAYIGDVRTEIYKTNVKTIKGKFDYKDGTYFLIMSKDKVMIKKAPWYSLGTQWIAVLHFEEGKAVPLHHNSPDLQADAYGMNRVMSKASRDTLLPSADSMLMFICALCLIGMLIMMGLAGYLLTDPNGAENIKGAFKPKAQQDIPKTGEAN